MKYPVLTWAVIVLGITGAMWWLNGSRVTDEKSATYRIEGQPVTLVGGRAEAPAAPGSAAMVVTQYFGNEAKGDLNNDGVADTAFILTQSSGGSGTFYYAVAAVKTETGYMGTDAVLLGDRIAPQTTEIRDGILIVNYAERRAEEPMTAQPSVGKSLYLKLDPATLQFGIVVQDFEGEANPAQMTLDMQTWTWVQTLYNDGTTITPKKESAFTITFKNDGTFSATTDCNGVGGDYTKNQNELAFSKMLSTLMYCEGSQEGEFTKELGEVQSYLFTSKGKLILEFKVDSGTMTFR